MVWKCVWAWCAYIMLAYIMLMRRTSDTQRWFRLPKVVEKNGHQILDRLVALKTGV